MKTMAIVGRNAIFVFYAFVVFSANEVSAQQTSDCSQFSSFQEYEAKWKSEFAGYAEHGAYPFGTQFCDKNATADQKSSDLNANIKFAIPYYGAVYRSLLISSNGYVSLNESSSTESSTHNYVAVRWPNPYYTPSASGAVDPPLIAPFYANTDYRVGTPNDPGQLSWRVLERSDATPVARGTLDLISEDVRRASVDAPHFVAQSGVVVTWYEVTYAGATMCSTEASSDTCRRNTFQMALVTDGIQTYVVFNYIKITWVGSGYMQRCDPATGMPSASSPNCQPAQVGFNAGFGRGFTSLPYTSAENVARLNKLSGTDVVGRWIYHVTHDVIRHAGCTSDPSLNEHRSWPLVTNPTHGPMFGGQWINVSGPCVHESQPVRCRFGTVETIALHWGNPMQVTCVQPKLSTVGSIRLSVSTGQGQKQDLSSSTVFVVLQQERVDDSMSVKVINPTGDWLSVSRLELRWNPHSLSSTHVFVQLFGYNHTTDWHPLYTFNSTLIENSGAFAIVSPSASLCTDQNSRSICSQFSFGAFRIHAAMGSNATNSSVRLPHHRACSNGTVCERDVVNFGWVPPPCNIIKNGTLIANLFQPQPPVDALDSGDKPQNGVTSSALSWLCRQYNPSQWQWHDLDCGKHLSTRHQNWTHHTITPGHSRHQNWSTPFIANIFQPQPPADDLDSGDKPQNGVTSSAMSWLCRQYNPSQWQWHDLDCGKHLSTRHQNWTHHTITPGYTKHHNWSHHTTIPGHTRHQNWSHHTTTPGQRPVILRGIYPCTDMYINHVFTSVEAPLPKAKSHTLSRSIWSDPIPLGWFVNAAATASEGQDWPHQRCTTWQSHHNPAKTTQEEAVKPTENWLSQVDHLSCPCVMRQAMIDFGRFQPSSDCNANESRSTGHCSKNREALGCFQSTHTTNDGSSNRCCYDKNGNLMYAGDSPSGSHAEYSAPWGLEPESHKVPSLSHWNDDRVPYDYCCGWQRPAAGDASNEDQSSWSADFAHDCLDVFAKARPTIDCKEYTPPGQGAVFGDPHLITFDGTIYTFNGWGEFWLINFNHSRNSTSTSNRARKGNHTVHQIVPAKNKTGGDWLKPFGLQGRFEPINETSGLKPSGTVLTAVAMHLLGSPVISIAINDHNARPRLLVYVNDSLMNFGDQNMFWQQQHHGIIVISHDRSNCSNVTVIFQEGIGVNVAWKNGVLHTIVSLHPDYEGKVEGLLGLWNGHPVDDLTPRGGANEPVPSSNSPNVYYKFGLTWIVEATETLFGSLYRSAMDYQYYRHFSFVPSFDASTPSSGGLLKSAQTPSSICGENKECLYDLATTGNPQLAADTLSAIQWYNETRQMAQPVVSCGWLNVPYSVRTGWPRYTLGSHVTIIDCLPGYQMSGLQTTYVCTATSTSDGNLIAVWSPGIDQTCRWLGAGGLHSAQMIVIIPVVIIGVTILVALVIICIICGARRRSERREHRANEKKATMASTSAPLLSTAPGPGQTIVSPLIVSRDPERAEVTVVTSNAYNRVVRGSMSESSFLIEASAPALYEVPTSISRLPPRYSLVSDSSSTLASSSVRAVSPMTSVVCGPVRLIHAPILDSRSNLDTTSSDVFTNDAPKSRVGTSALATPAQQAPM